jgi:hypothetical protein
MAEAIRYQPQHLTEAQKTRIRWQAERAYFVGGDQHCPYAAGTPEAEQFRQYIRNLQDDDR